MKRILLFLLTVFIASSGFAQTSETYYDLDDKKYSFEDITSGGKNVLFIWATWCPTCRAKLAELNTGDTLRKDIKIIYLNIGENRSLVLRTLDALKIPQERRKDIFRDPFEAISDRFYFVAIPTVIFFKDGKALKTANSLTARILEAVYGPETAVEPAALPGLEPSPVPVPVTGQAKT